VTGTEIPVQTRMMTIADIFDALTATDRPYKRAVPAERALDILSEEAKEGMIDENLLRTFIEAKIYLALVAG
jgi:HD-GYP domain-containing protein (c-di-GMP phosphodiesterase class II)